MRPLSAKSSEFFVIRGQSVRSLLASTSSNERPTAVPGAAEPQITDDSFVLNLEASRTLKSF
jgi:hypothetical protein